MIKAAIEVISEALQSYGGRQTRTSTHVMILCPFHSDGTPSCGVFMAEGMSIPLGTYHCFGCGVSGSWNALAEKCGFPTIKGWSTTFSDGIKDIDIRKEYGSLSELIATMKVPYSDWPKELEWRGFSGDTIRRVGGIMVDDKYLKSIAAFFPVYIGDSLKGGVKAAFKKEKGGLPYITTKGDWVLKYGLFPYNAIKRMKKDYVILVEGPRDALRLYEKGLPALAVLGSQNFNVEKALMVSSLMPEIAISLPDNDEAGIKLRKSIKSHMSQYCKTISVSLPEDVSDPNNMSDKDIRNLKNLISNI